MSEKNEKLLRAAPIRESSEGLTHATTTEGRTMQARINAAIADSRCYTELVNMLRAIIEIPDGAETEPRPNEVDDAADEARCWRCLDCEIQNTMDAVVCANCRAIRGPRSMPVATYLKDGETPTECIARNRRDVDTVLWLLTHSKQCVADAEAELDAILNNTRKCFAEDSDAEEFLRRVTNARLALAQIGSVPPETEPRPSIYGDLSEFDPDCPACVSCNAPMALNDDCEWNDDWTLNRCWACLVDEVVRLRAQIGSVPPDASAERARVAAQLAAMRETREAIERCIAQTEPLGSWSQLVATLRAWLAGSGNHATSAERADTTGRSK